MIKGFVFDLDGTLLDTLDDIKEALKRFLTNHNFATHSRENVKTMVGNGAQKLIERALPKLDFSVEEKKSFYEEYIKIYENTQDFTKIYDGIDEVLDCLIAKNCKIAVVTNKPDTVSQLCRERFLGKWKIDPFFGQKENVPIKPDPFMLNKVVELWNYDKSEVVFVGDSPEDIITAKNAGVIGIGAAWGFRDAKTLNEVGALCSPETPRDFIKEIRKFGFLSEN
jgi:phosphoglycolate phosphatase